MADRAPSSTVRSVVIGTAGHIDHGKTALVRALTGIDTDRLPEEKRRGITIDLGFASMETSAPDGSPLRLSFIDVPGHARFVRNMLAGTGGIDAVLLVISAEEGVKPQTEEHLAICSLLGIRHGITVVTKTDAVREERLREVRRSVESFLGKTILESAPIVACSAASGSGIAELRHELSRIAATIPPRGIEALVRLPIDRVFLMKGFGTVVTGTLIGGSIRIGDELAVEPSARLTRARGIQVHSHAEAEASAGSRVALNLARIEARQLERGDTLVAPGGIAAVDMIDVELMVLPGAQALKHRVDVHFHAFASECFATATLYDAARVEPGESGLARLKLAHPVVLVPHDRFVLRAGSPIATVGGGRVLDAHPLAHLRKPKTAEWLRDLRSASSEEHVWLRIARRGAAGITLPELSNETGLLENPLEGLIEQWIRDRRACRIDSGHILSHQSLLGARDSIMRHLRARDAVGSATLKRSELREQVHLEPGVFDRAIGLLDQDRELRLVGEFVALSDAAASPDRDRALLLAIAAEYGRAGVTPPSPDELATRMGIAPGEMRRLITLLLREKTLVRLGRDSLCIDRRALDELAARVQTWRGKMLDVSAFKQLAGVSRKYAIPLLEHFDRERITAKHGDHRLVL